MQKLVDYYFLVVSCIISIMSFSFCLYDNNLGNILLFCFSATVSFFYIINVLKTKKSASFRLVVKCVSVLLSIIMAFFLPIAVIMATFKYEITIYIVICFCILNIILAFCMKTEVRNHQDSSEHFYEKSKFIIHNEQS